MSVKTHLIHTRYYPHTIANSHSLITINYSLPLALLSMLFALHPLDVPAIFTISSNRYNQIYHYPFPLKRIAIAHSLISRVILS